MKVFNKRKVGCSKKFAAKAAMYRRLAKGMGGNFEFSHEDLLELYRYESTGAGGKSAFETMRQRNGFAFGKWLRDIDVAQYKEDLNNGLFNPKELLEGMGLCIIKVLRCISIGKHINRIGWIHHAVN